MTTTTPGRLRRPALALLLWAWYTAIALLAASPFFAWLARDTGTAPETDALLNGLQFGTFFELLQASRGSFGGVTAALTATLALAALSNAFLGGGLFASVAAPGEGRLLARFFEAAGRYFFRSLGLLLATAVLGAIVAGLVAAGASALLGVLLAQAGERGSVARTAILLVLVGAVAAFFLLALDYARVWMVSRDAKGFVRTWLRGAGFVLRHPLKAVVPGLVFGVAIAATLALAAWVPWPLGGATWGAILTVLLVQQALLYLRVLLRVGMAGMEARTALGGWERGASASREPRPAEVAPQPAVEERPVEEPADEQPATGPVSL